ncbi:hypothetical protein [Allorhodopirellula solitaria]|uniref:FlgN protein n=1 Tax=Allorhodopirellula solitaria TaxID=2527987 RepID=A0A5C5YHN7_9BACT|nr:hypothetical protein [Allorhodopirellula solitaria]TWT74365.1 hypothetical protein CA85_12540 [Allorhodopirellula solitaria]
MNAGSSLDHSEALSWREQVASYLIEATGIANSIDLILDETRMVAPRRGSDEIDESTQQLIVAISDLERMVEKRNGLLRAADAPPVGLSLSEKLLSTRRIEDARLARLCGEVADQIALTHERAMSLFICQYHLAGSSHDIGAILAAGSNSSSKMESDRDSGPSDDRLNKAA